MEKPFDVFFVTSEIFPFSKTGGLADVMGALPPALAKFGVRVGVITPLYGRLRTADYKLRLVDPDCPVGYPWAPITAEIYQADYHGVTVYFVQRDEYFDRRHYYNTYKGDYFDNCERFTYFSRAVMQWIRRMDVAPRIVNSNDWQSALVPAMISHQRTIDPFFADIKTVQTIHNLAFQGRFDSRLFAPTGLPAHFWNVDGSEYYGDFNMLKTGIAYADMITTVSPTYAREIVTAKYGSGLEGILAKRRPVLRGVLNGVDYDVWDPGRSRYLPRNYSLDDLSGKKACKRWLLKAMYLSDMLEDKPLLGFVGRLRRQKGIDLLIDILPKLMQQEIGVVVLGEGNLQFEAELMEMVERYPGRLAVKIGYTEDLAHLIQAGCDMFLMPSRYEPCGLTQMYALRFGTLPVATSVGGLRDTINPFPGKYATGFTFPLPDSGLFLSAIKKALKKFEDQEYWQDMMERAMMQDFSWERSAESYLNIYREMGVPISTDSRRTG